MITKILPFFIIASVVLLYAAEPNDTTAPWERDDSFYSNVTKENFPSPEEEIVPPPEQKSNEVQVVGDQETQSLKVCKNCDKEEKEFMEEFDSTEESADEGMEKHELEAIYPPSLYMIVLRHAEKLKRQARLHWMGSRGLRKSRVGKFFLAYECYHPLDIEQARKLLVYAVESLLKTINAGDVPHPQLKHYPLTSQDIDVEIRFDTFFGEYVDRQYVELCEMKNNLVTYYSFSCQTAFGKCCHRYERYPDAVNAVRVNLELWGTDCDIKCQRDQGVAIDEAIPFDRIFKLN